MWTRQCIKCSMPVAFVLRSVFHVHGFAVLFSGDLVDSVSGTGMLLLSQSHDVAT